MADPLTASTHSSVQAFLTYDPPYPGAIQNTLQIVLFLQALDVNNLPYVVLDPRQLWGINPKESHLAVRVRIVRAGDAALHTLVEGLKVGNPNRLEIRPQRQVVPLRVLPQDSKKKFLFEIRRLSNECPLHLDLQAEKIYYNFDVSGSLHYLRRVTFFRFVITHAPSDGYAEEASTESGSEHSGMEFIEEEL
ncbi:hypothetical protein EIP91_003855 [Steccherinum ochraceum]|uniref:Uncharacterized protein n=1 Tax=Steccherinum ochraceum TaxID=92696 RepID=A0A4R0R9U0_9APHY|nr:hypothetical protein EIP91_003855 [Steccherinum ochraceum]